MQYCHVIDDSLSTFPVEQSDLKLFKPIVSLAQRIDSAQHKTDKAKHKDDWFVKMAKEADLGLSEDERLVFTVYMTSLEMEA